VKILNRCAAALIGLSLLAVTGAQAAVPASVTTAFTEMETDFESIFGYAFAVLVTITVAMIAWRYTKKFGNRL
jgi:hypothetical protein